MSVERYCPKCGVKLSPGESFCSNCGTRVETTSSPKAGEVTPSAEAKMFCSQCGAEIPADAAFCLECGKAVKPLMREVSDDKWSNGVMALLIIVTILLPLIGIIGGIYGLSKEAKRSQGVLLLGIAVFLILVNLLFVGFMEL